MGTITCGHEYKQKDVPKGTVSGTSFSILMDKKSPRTLAMTDFLSIIKVSEAERNGFLYIVRKHWYVKVFQGWVRLRSSK